jgi:hypothetical protein
MVTGERATRNSTSGELRKVGTIMRTSRNFFESILQLLTTAPGTNEASRACLLMSVEWGAPGLERGWRLWAVHDPKGSSTNLDPE